jgi:hypothetical protein
VSLFRIYIRRPSSSIPIENATDLINTSSSPTPTSPITTPPIDIFKDILSMSSDSSLSKSRLNSFNFSPSMNDKKRLGVLILTDQSASSEEAGFETDSMDELSSPGGTDGKSIASFSFVADNLNEMITQVIIHYNSLILIFDYFKDIDNVSNPTTLPTWHEESLTDDQKQEMQMTRSRSSTKSNEMEHTIKLERINSVEETGQIHITQINLPDSDDESLEEFPVFRGTLSDSFRDRTTTVTSHGNSHPHPPSSDRHEVRISWTDIPDTNKEHERDSLVLYVQRNSRMMFAGILEQSLLSDEYLRKLVRIKIKSIE